MLPTGEKAALRLNQPMRLYFWAVKIYNQPMSRKNLETAKKAAGRRKAGSGMARQNIAAKPKTAKYKRRYLPVLMPEWLNLGRLPWALRFSILILATALLSFCLQKAHSPAALLLGPMLSAIFLSLGNIDLKIDSRLFTMAQGIIGCMVGSAITPRILHEAATDWPIFIGGVVSVILAATFIGYFLAKRQILPGTAAIWGSAAGGASAMVLMADSYGADVRLVALMQYMRVVLVALTAAALAHWCSPHAAAAAAPAFFPPFAAKGLLITLLLAFGGALGARYILRIPAGAMLLPFLLTVILQNAGLFSPVLPPWLLAIFYMLIGWNIGLRFTRAMVLHGLALMPVLLLSTVTLMGICAAFAVILSLVSGMDLLTAYLATSPGGADSIAIIAAGTHVDTAFVMAYQSVRFLLVTISGPFIASSIAKYLDKKLPQPKNEKSTA